MQEKDQLLDEATKNPQERRGRSRGHCHPELGESGEGLEIIAFDCSWASLVV